MIIKIMAGGRNPAAALQTDATDRWIGVDRGLGYLLERHIKPEMIFGDFDSLPEVYHAFVEKFQAKEVYASQKDETDLELALNWATRQNPSEIQIYGATGGRLDHELANIDLMYHYFLQGITLKMIDEQNEMFFIGEGTHHLKKDGRFTYISFLPYLTDIQGFTLRGFKYPLKQAAIKKGKTLTISNEFHQDMGTISLVSGIVLVIKSSDSMLDSLG